MIKAVCSYPGCAEWATMRGRCAAHRWRKTTRETRRQRAKALARNRGRCVDCGARATIAHHVVERQHGGSDDASNLIGLCDHCHKARHDHA